MIHEVAVEIATKIKARSCPIPVIDGPEPTGTATFGRERIVIEESESDNYAPPYSQQRNPSRRMVCEIGAKATIYGQSTKAGALYFEHRRRARLILDQVLVALSEIKSVRKGRGSFTPTGGRWVFPPDLEKSERPGGAIYELSFTFERAIEERTWAGDKRPEGTLTAIAMTGNPNLTFDEEDSTITRSAGSWLDDGFTVGLLATVKGSVSNNVTGEISVLTDTVLTFAATTLADEGPVSNCAVLAGGFSNTTRVSVNGSDDYEYIPEPEV